MAILIDDAGWGSLAGGVLFGACREESPETHHAFREISVSAFQGDAYERKTYLELAVVATQSILKELAVLKDEQIHICTGYVLQSVRGQLVAEGYTVIPAKIGDPLQTMIETEFLNRILALGVDTDFETMTRKQGLYFWQCMYWLKGGDMESDTVLPNRARHCKTGWPTYPIWSSHPYADAKVLAKRFKDTRKLRNRRSKKRR